MEIYSFDFDSTLGKVPQSTDDKMVELYTSLTGAERDLISQTQPTPYSYTAHLRYLQANDLEFLLEKTAEEVRLLLHKEFQTILFDDAIPILVSLKERGNKIAIVTYGGEDYQALKLSATGLEGLVDDIFITAEPNSKGIAVAQLNAKYHPSRITHIDDRESELDGVKTVIPTADVIRIIRAESEDDSPSKYKTITSLSDLI